MRRGRAPSLGRWAPPGGRVEWGETVAEAGRRELSEETNLSATLAPLSVFAAFDAMERDGDGQVVFHYVLVELTGIAEAGAQPRAGDDADHCAWWPVAQLHQAQPQVETLQRAVSQARDYLRGVELT